MQDKSVREGPQLKYSNSSCALVTKRTKRQRKITLFDIMPRVRKNLKQMMVENDYMCRCR